MSNIRLNKFIAEAGICSRRKADSLIDEGRVKVNGNVQTQMGITIDTEIDKIEVDNRVINVIEDKKYIILNKPVGYVTTVNEQFARPCVIDLIKEDIRVYPVGRLDMNTSGILILTNDGEFTNRITHPKNHIYKTYEVETKNDISKEDIEKLKNGVDIGGYVTMPAKVKNIKSNKLVISIGEGKNRQIRKMCEAINNKVVKLNRISIGKLTLETLKSGEYKYVTKKELDKVFE